MSDLNSSFEPLRVLFVEDDVLVRRVARALPTDRRRCAAAGMDECVTKPLHARTLMEAIDRLVGETRVIGERRSLVALSES